MVDINLSSYKVDVKGDWTFTVTVRANHETDSGWWHTVDKLLRLKDTGNGYKIKSYSYNQGTPHKTYYIDYDEAVELYAALKEAIELNQKVGVY